jgi:hypothetical protein
MAVADPIDVCPTCGQRIGIGLKWKPVRICSRCQKPIAKGHKWRIVNSTIEHRRCDRPDAYEGTPPREELNQEDA